MSTNPDGTRFISLAEGLGLIDPPSEAPSNVAPRLEDIKDAKAFATAVLESIEFRRYILNGLTYGELPAAIITRLMDYAWGKPVDRVEHTGKDGSPIVTEVRRVIVRSPVVEEDLEEEPTATRSPVTH